MAGASRGTVAGRASWSQPLVVVGSVLLGLAALCVVAYATFLDTSTFARSVDEIRTTPAVSAALGAELADQIVAAEPDLVAVRPLIEQVAAFVAGSDVLSPLVVQAAARVQQAATTGDGAGIVLTLADAGVVATSVLQTVAPDVADQVPGDLSLTLASLSDQPVVANVLLASRYLRAAAFTLPLLALAALAAAIWLSPQRRRTLVRVGLGAMVAGGVIGVGTLVLGVAVAFVDASTLTGALADGAWRVWSRGYWVATAVLVVAGALLAAAASARLPDLDVDAYLQQARRRLTARPTTTTGVAVRGVGLAALGVGLVVAPLRLLSWGAMLAGLAVLAYGISEITQAAAAARMGEVPADDARGAAAAAGGPAAQSGEDEPPVGWRLGLLAGALVVVLLAGVAFLVQGVRTAPSEAAAVSVGEGRVCNGHAELCGRPYDQVTYLTTHNAMSAADQPGWYLAEQSHGVVDQLGGGVRALMLDVWKAVPAGEYASSLTVDLTEGRAQLEESFGAPAVASAERLVQQVVGEPTGPPALYLCHGLCEIGSTPLAPTLGELRAWLDANPDEVVTLLVENHVPADDIGAAVVAAGLAPYVYDPGDGRTWPTLREMIRSGQRLVVMTEEGQGSGDYPWLANAFALTQDTPYTFPDVESFSCEPNRGPSDAPLLLVNHWLSGFGNLVSAAQQVNTAEVLGARLRECAGERGRQPTFVGLNYYDLGDGAAVVDELNGVS
jgi:hypothetical protein